jgi:peroxiredoxin
VKLENKIEELNSMGVQVIAICKGTALDSQRTKNKTKGLFTFVSDLSGSFIDSFGLLDEEGNPFNGEDTARIGKMLVDKKAEMLWFRFTKNNRVRIASAELISEIDQVIKNRK